MEGLHYLCKICEETFIPIKRSRKNKERIYTETTSEDTSLLQRNEDQNKNLDTVFKDERPRKKTVKTDKKAICHFFAFFYLGHANMASQEEIARLNIRNCDRNF